jgi:hypothetical protein
VTFVAVWTRGNTSALADFAPFIAVNEHIDEDTGEAAAYLTGDRFNIIAGGSVFSGGDQLSVAAFGFPFPITPLRFDAQSLWLYGNLVPVTGLRLTLGGALDRLSESVKETETLDLTKFDPKLGISWDVLPSTTLRAAWFETLKRPLIGVPDNHFRSGGQTIEPTQISGFDQLFDDPPGVQARSWGVGIDQRFAKPFLASDTLLLGAEWLQRQPIFPIIFNVLGSGVPQVIESGSRERYGRAYLSWLPLERLAINAAVDYTALYGQEPPLASTPSPKSSYCERL